jgi:4-hydroxybenzoate polyprenyltransferase
MRSKFPRDLPGKRGFRPFGPGYAPTMAAFIAILLAALLLAFGFAFAAPWLVFVPIAIVLAFVIWVGSLLVARRTPQEAVRRTKRPQLLGPGGPDDPTA